MQFENVATRMVIGNLWYSFRSFLDKVKIYNRYFDTGYELLKLPKNYSEIKLAKRKCNRLENHGHYNHGKKLKIELLAVSFSNSENIADNTLKLR
jgi:myosin-crossreactive antigen